MSSSITITHSGSTAGVPGTRALGSGNVGNVGNVGGGAGTGTILRARGTRGMMRLRFLPVIGVLLATIVTVTGCCAGYCSSSKPPIGAGVIAQADSHG
jgi:hypothetical protein